MFSMAIQDRAFTEHSDCKDFLAFRGVRLQRMLGIFFFGLSGRNSLCMSVFKNGVCIEERLCIFEICYFDLILR